MKTITYSSYEHALYLYRDFNKKKRFRKNNPKENRAVIHAIEILKLYAVQNHISVLIRGELYNRLRYAGCSAERIRF